MNNDISKVDYDLFDALSRRITLKFMPYSEEAINIWKNELDKAIEILRKSYGNKEIP